MFWAVYPCQPAAPDCLKISAAPRLKFYAYYDGTAHLANGRWTLTVDVSDGLQCLPGYAMPTRETWTWDEATLAGTIEFRRRLFERPPIRSSGPSPCRGSRCGSRTRRRHETTEQFPDNRATASSCGPRGRARRSGAPPVDPLACARRGQQWREDRQGRRVGRAEDHRTCAAQPSNGLGNTRARARGPRL